MAHIADDIGHLISAASVIVAGPGLGRDQWAKHMLQQCVSAGLPLLLDADALNLIAAGEVKVDNLKQAVLTPHPGEAARLLGTDTAAVQADRYAAAQALQAQYGGVVILKGAGSIVADADGLTVIPSGNAGMAAGGSGDVLSGVVGALIAQGFGLAAAATLGAYAHGLAGDIAAQQGQRGMAASDLISCVRKSVNP